MINYRKHYCDKYGLAPVQSHGNQVRSYEAECDSCLIRLDTYSSTMLGFHIGVGEVRHYPGRSRTPLGEFGMLSAGSVFKKHHNPENIVGSAIPGNELIGLKYRISAVAPKSRDSSPINNLHDQYIQTHDIIRYLLMCVPQVIGKRASGKDPLCRPEHWETLERGF